MNSSDDHVKETTQVEKRWQKSETWKEAQMLLRNCLVFDYFIFMTFSRWNGSMKEHHLLTEQFFFIVDKEHRTCLNRNYIY